MWDGLRTIKVAFKLLFRYPAMALPLLFVCALYSSCLAIVKLYSQIYPPSGSHTTEPLYPIILIISFFLIVPLATTLSNIATLSMLTDIETEASQPNVRTAVTRALRLAPRVFILSILAALVRFVLFFLAALSRKSGASEASSGISSGDHNTALGLFLTAGAKVVRMGVLLCLPAIAWENYSPRQSVYRSINIIKTNPSGFYTNFATSYIFLIAIFVVLIVKLPFGPNSREYLETVIVIKMLTMVMLYILSVYVELVMMAAQYIRHIKWEHAVEAARQAGRTAPVIKDIPMPSFLDEFNDLAFLNPTNRD